MGQETIDDILKRKQAEKSAATATASEPAPVPAENTGDKFFGILVGDGDKEDFLEFQTRDGVRTCFPYTAIIWIVYEPEGALTAEFGGYVVTIMGRGLAPKLLDGIKRKRVAWIKEADHELQDHKDNETYISDIIIEGPEGFGGDVEEQPTEG